MSEILPASSMRADAEVDVAVIGAGAAGLVAALRAAEAGADVLVLERDEKPTGSTSMSSGFVPAPGTRFQRAIGVTDDTPELFAADIQAKNKAGASPPIIGNFVVYDLPDRDCAALASNGELSIANGGAAKYQQYIDSIAAVMNKYPDTKVILVIGMWIEHN